MTDAPEAVVRLDKVSKHFGPQAALDDVSLEVPAGVVFALLGDNGAGKTTAMRILLSLEDADSGQCTVLGLDSRRDGRKIRQLVGYVPERPTLYTWMTVDETGWFAAGFHAPGYLERYRELASHYQLPPRKKIRALSKGMVAKVSLCLATASDPKLLILDEPTSGLDAMVRREFLESMVDIAATGRTVLLASHQIGEVERVADHVAILREGKLLVVDRLDQLKKVTRELVITLSDGLPAPPAVAGVILSERRKDRQWRLLIESADDGPIELLRRHSAVANLEVHTPSLEEIFVARLRKGVDK